jgi:LysR family glycine cleavage system transcriptional activator
MNGAHASSVSMDARPEGPLPLPPLTALRTFEVAARRSSFTRAAEELCVTQTAVSHQIRLLEDHLGLALFRRLSRRVVLTAEGQAWAEALSDAFGRLYAANRRLRNKPAGRRPLVSVSVLPSFASRWLIPRLGRFLDLHPEVDVRISPKSELADFEAEAIDFGIRYGHGRYPGLRVEKLYDDAWVVVCALTLRGRAALKTPHDLVRLPMIRDDDPDAVGAWFLARGIRDFDPDRGTMLSDSSLVVEAAVRGQGVGLARLSLAIDDLSAGRLVRPFPRVRPMPTGRAYYLASPRGRSMRPEVAAFREWLRAEVQALAAR